MRSIDFIKVRGRLGKTQAQMANILGVSLKAVQSFEQGWRKVPDHVERQLLFILCLMGTEDLASRPCWEVRRCTPETREHCMAWQAKAGGFCWFVTGTLCEGVDQGSWEQKMEACRQCGVFQAKMRPAHDEAISVAFERDENGKEE